MNAKRTKRQPAGRARTSLTDWKRLGRQTDRQIARAIADDPGTFEESAAWIRDMGKLAVPNPKERLTVRFDADMVAWFRRQGRGYQTRMNEVLRSYYEHARKSKRRA